MKKYFFAFKIILVSVVFSSLVIFSGCYYSEQKNSADSVSGIADEFVDNGEEGEAVSGTVDIADESDDSAQKESDTQLNQPAVKEVNNITISNVTATTYIKSKSFYLNYGGYWRITVIGNGGKGGNAVGCTPGGGAGEMRQYLVNLERYTVYSVYWKISIGSKNSVKIDLGDGHI